MRYPFLMISAVALMAVTICTNKAQAEKQVEILKTLNYSQGVTPEMMDNYLYSTYYYNGKKAYNMKAFEIFKSSMPIVDMKVNPSGSSYAVLSSNEKKTLLTVRGLNEGASAKPWYEKEQPVTASALCYTADSRHIIVADGAGNLIFYRSSDGQEESRISIPVSSRVDRMVASPNDYYIAVQTKDKVVVINQENKSVRKSIDLPGACWVDFSDDSEMLGVLTASRLEIYNTRTFTSSNTFNGLVSATSFSFHPEGKYATVAEQGNMLNFYNLVDSSEKLGIVDAAGSVSQVNYLRDGKKQIYLTFNAPNTLKYRLLANLSPNYKRMLRDELERRMRDFIRQREGETKEQYNERVTEENIRRHRQLVANELATQYAGNLAQRAGITLGRYDKRRGVLAVNVTGTRSNILLKMPETEAGTFANANDVEFRNVQYGLTENDSFEIVYAEVYNKSTGKTYTYDNRDQQNLDFLTTETELHLIEDIKTAQREEVELKRRTQQIVDKAKEFRKIEHTSISTNTQILRTTDASGRSIKNYQVDFEYNVDAAYSFVEDFAPGKYKIEESHAATTMLEAITESFSHDFAKYLVEGKKMEITVTGTADASPIKGRIAYDGCYGEFEGEPYFLDDNLNNITITPKTGITMNEQLAFVRGQGVRNYLMQHLKAITHMDVRYVNKIELPEGKGGQYRRIKVRFSFVDANI